MTAALLALLIAAAPPPAPAVEGIWVAHMPETASALRLDTDGRFAWFFSQGALDLAGEGRWTRDGEAVLLTSDPPPVPPRTTLIATARDAEPGLLVRIADAQGQPAGYLDLAGERADGERVFGFAQEGEYRFGPEESRGIVAVYVGSRVFGFISERFAVPAGDNVLSFRFEANDVAKADFRGQRLIVGHDQLRMDYKGLELTYAREQPSGEQD